MCIRDSAQPVRQQVPEQDRENSPFSERRAWPGAQGGCSPRAPRVLQPAGGLERPKPVERWQQGDRFSRFWKKQVSAAMLQALETSHLLSPSVLPILTLKKPTWKLPLPCMLLSFLHGPPSNGDGCDGIRIPSSRSLLVKVLQQGLCWCNPSARHKVTFIFLYPECLVKCPTTHEKG